MSLPTQYERDTMAHSKVPPDSPILDSPYRQSLHGMPQNMAQPRCCCGRSDCAYLRHNILAMEGLEKDIRSAAQIGQALLERHETYMADAEEERRKMAASIDRLETDKKELEASNAKTIEENRNLLDQLEELNNNVSNSDIHITSLNATLLSTRKEMERLTVLAAKTVRLEAQLLAVESEQASLQDQLAATGEDERSAVQRWKNAERTINHLQVQIDRIEREARDGREKHAEVLGRFERRRAMERELERAEGRLKGAAGATTLERDRPGSSVVSHFVKDILQDNANLQSGIVELREMLLGSNQEVENLREQMMLHQPIRTDQDDDISEALLEGGSSNPSAIETLPELHVHHHYHAAINESPARARSSGPRRPRKKRNVLMSGYATPSSDPQTPRTPSTHGLRVAPPSSAATVLSQTSASIPAPPPPRFPHRWSSQSSQTWASNTSLSVPSSPQSTALFDGDVSIASSRPTSPEPMSPDLAPYFFPQHKKGSSDVSYRGLSASISRSNATQTISSVLQDPADEPLSPPAKTVLTPASATIHEEPEPDVFYPNTGNGHSPATSRIHSSRPHLHRSTSHESILSISGLDLASPSQSRCTSGSTPRLPFPISTTSSMPITAATPFLARASFRPQHAHLNRVPSGFPLSAASSALAQSATVGRASGNLGKKVGGWVWGSWSVGAVGENAGGTDETSEKTAPPRPAGLSKTAAALSASVSRPPPRPAGVNQTGSLVHLKREVERRAAVEVGKVDEGLLAETLGEM